MESEKELTEKLLVALEVLLIQNLCYPVVLDGYKSVKIPWRVHFDGLVNDSRVRADIRRKFLAIRGGLSEAHPLPEAAQEFLELAESTKNVKFEA